MQFAPHAFVSNTGRRPGVLRRLAGPGAAGAQVAVLEPVTARGHLAPRALAAARPVVEGPAAVRVAAQPQALPAAVGLGVADGEQQPGQAIGQAALTAGPQSDPAVRGHPEPGRGLARHLLQRPQFGLGERRPAGVAADYRAQALPGLAGQPEVRVEARLVWIAQPRVSQPGTSLV